MKLLRLLGLALIATAMTLPLGGAATSQEQSPSPTGTGSPSPSASSPAPTQSSTTVPVDEPWPNRVSLQSSRSRVTFGSRVRLAGRVTSDYPDTPPRCFESRVVTLSRTRFGKTVAQTIATATTRSDGRFRFTLSPTASASYVAYVSQTDECGEGYSPVRPVKVRLRLEARDRGRRIVAAATPCRGHRGDRVQLKRFSGPKDVFVEIVGKKRLNERCRAWFRDPGGNRLQVVWPKQDADHERGRAWVR